ncbi:MAG TPA: endonuclease Q family protein [Patescibacteria group bacterium]|nr:endonuclease Q family protein [Patescibacteria group bacterium]
MEKVLDLHIHSRYSRACSRDLNLPQIAQACEQRGIEVVATGDFTHPAWLAHLQENLIEDQSGLYKLKNNSTPTRFLLGTELAVIKKHKGQTRRLHLCVFAPDLATVVRFNQKLEGRGFNLKSDGRPILGLTAKELLQLILETDERMVLIPAHAWTPWFGIFGSKGGYDSLEEAFEELTPRVRAIETGLSSDPLMNWRWSKLDNITLISNSDAHSCAKLGREANIFSFANEADMSYAEIMRIIQEGDRNKFLYTIEFYPEEGKYHYDGHRDCQFVCSPEETRKLKGLCPRCHRPLVIGVCNRVSQLADRSEKEAENLARVPFKSLVPLPEILADVFQVGVNTKRVKQVYTDLLQNLGNEFKILLYSSLRDIAQFGGEDVAQAIERVRAGKIFVRPGYDGEFGIVKVYAQEGERTRKKQIALELE